MQPNDIRNLTVLAVVLIVAIIGKYVLKWSAKDFILSMIKEFSELLARNPTPGAINALGLIAAFIFLSASLFIPSFEKLLRLAHSPNPTPTTPALPIFCALFMLVGAIVCVRMVRNNTER